MTYQVLLVEERIADAELIREALRQSAISCKVTHVRKLADALALSVNNRFDAVFLNLFLTDSQGLDTYVAMRSHAPALPLILVSDSANQGITLEAAKKGAQDHLAIDEVSASVIAKTLLYAIERKRHERELREQKEFYENLLKEANVWVEALDRRGTTILWNTGAEKISGYSEDTIISTRRRWELLFPQEEYRQQQLALFEAMLRRERSLRDHETEIRTASGARRLISWNANIIGGSTGEVVGCMLVGNDVTERRDSDRDLLESEHRFRTLAELTTDYVYAAAVNEDGGIVAQWVEGAFERITGYATAEILGRSGVWWDIIDRQTAPTPEAFAAAMQQESAVFEYRIRCKDGSVRWLRDRLRYLRDGKSGRPHTILGAVSDITEEKEARSAEILARQTLDTLINSTHDYAFLLTPDGLILSAGPNIAAFFGSTPEEMKGQTLFDFTPPDYPEENRERLRRLCSTREVYEYTADFGGHRIQVRGTPVFDASGNPTLIAVFGQDVTEEHRAQEFLRREQEKFRGIVENSTDGISLIDGSGRFLEWNPALEVITGIARDEVLQRYQWDVQMQFTPAEERTEELHAEYKRVMEEYLSKGSAPWLNRLFSRWIEHRNGTRRRIEMVSFRVSSSFDMLTATITRDITEMALAEMELERKRQLLADQNTELLERNEELDTFTHSVAHDLKNPLSLILGYAELAQYEGPDFSKEELQDYMTSIIFNGKKMISIINSLLLLASARKEDVEVGEIDMQQIVSDAIRRLQKQISDSGITITLPERWYAPLGYAPWIEEVWVNYIGNAIKHAGNGCHVLITAERDESGLLRYSVTDNGPGIPAGRLDELFLPFTRLSQAKIEGHGLGLSIVKRIIEKQGGQVGVISTVGEGSSFSFSLPDAEAGR